jgi:V/A-type H+/Na+-transporting ATPase subunit C
MARIRYDEQNYIYGSARVHAIEARISAGERVLRAAEAKNVTDALRIFEECGIRVSDGNVEEALEAQIDEAYKVLGEVAPIPSVFNILRYPYDCHNIKSSVKCSFRGTDAARLMYNSGSVPPSEILRITLEREFSGLPHYMAQAASSAFEAYYRNADPQQIDSALDKACFLDMIDSAEQFDLPYLRDLVAYKADMINILTCVRLIRMNAKAVSIKNMILPGGIISNETFTTAFNAESISERETALYRALRKTRYNTTNNSVIDSLTKIECSCENAFLSFVRGEAKKTLFGAQILAAFVIARETEVKNIRIVITGRAASLPAEVIKERLRTYA